MTWEELHEEWMLTRERLTAHIERLQPQPRLHSVGGPGEAAKRALERLTAWRTELDELVIETLMPK